MTHDTHWEEDLGHTNLSPVYGHELDSLFVETMNDHGSEQPVNLPTRGNHIIIIRLDIIYSS